MRLLPIYLTVDINPTSRVTTPRIRVLRFNAVTSASEIPLLYYHSTMKRSTARSGHIIVDSLYGYLVI